MWFVGFLTGIVVGALVLFVVILWVGETWIERDRRHANARR